MPISPEQIFEIFPNRELYLSSSLPQQIQQMLQGAGIIVYVKDFSKDGPDANSSFEPNELLLPLTSLNKNQLSTILRLVYDYQRNIEPDQELVIGQYQKPTKVKIYGDDGQLDHTILATHFLGIPQTNMNNGIFIGHTTFEINVDGNFDMSRLTTNA